MRDFLVSLVAWGLLSGLAVAAPSARVLKGSAVPGIDYKGSEVTFVLAFEDIDAQWVAGVRAKFTVNGKTYEATPVDSGDGTYSVCFSIDQTGTKAVIAGKSYLGTLDVRLDSVASLQGVTLQLKQGTVTYTPKAWFNDPHTATWSDGTLEKSDGGVVYTPRNEMPSAVPAVIESTVRFDNICDSADDWPDGVQCAVRIAAGEAGPRFQVFAAERQGDGWQIGWHDANESDGAALTPEKGVTYPIKLEVSYRAAISGEPDLFVCWVKMNEKEDYRKLFTGALVNERGEVGGADHCSELGLSGAGDITSCSGSYSTESLNDNLVRADGKEYANVATAVSAGGNLVKNGTRKLELLYEASWKPTNMGAGITNCKYSFVHSEFLHLDLSSQNAGYLYYWQPMSDGGTAYDLLVITPNKIGLGRLRRSVSCADELLCELLGVDDGSPAKLVKSDTDIKTLWKGSYAGNFIVDSRATALAALRVDNTFDAAYGSSKWLNESKLPGENKADRIRLAMKLQDFDDERAEIVAVSDTYTVLRKWCDGSTSLTPEACAKKSTVLVSAAVGAKKMLAESDIAHVSAACANGTMTLRTKFGNDAFGEVCENLLAAAFGLIGSAQLDGEFAAERVLRDKLTVDKLAGVVEVQAKPVTPTSPFFFKTTVR